MRVKVLTANVLVNQEKGIWAGLAEEVDIPKSRAEYLLSIGAVTKLEDAGPAADDESPQGDSGKADGTSTTEQDPATGEKKAEPEQKAAPARRAPVTKK